MPGTVIGVNMNQGYPGSYARNPDDVVASRRVTTAGFAPGAPVVLNADNTYSAFLAAGTFATFAGFACREVKNITANFAAQTTDPAYAVGDIADVLERGNIIVTVTRGTPTAGGAVYVRTVLGNVPDAGAVVGGIEAAVPADGGTSIQLTNCAFVTGTLSANGSCEVCVMTRNRP